MDEFEWIIEAGDVHRFKAINLLQDIQQTYPKNFQNRYHERKNVVMSFNNRMVEILESTKESVDRVTYTEIFYVWVLSDRIIDKLGRGYSYCNSNFVKDELKLLIKSLLRVVNRALDNLIVHYEDIWFSS